MKIGLEPLREYLDNPDVSEVMVVEGRKVWVETREGIYPVGELNAQQVAHCVEYISRTSGRRIDLLAPILDARLDDGTRACIVIPPISLRGISINLRKFPSRILPLAAFGSEEASAIVRQLVFEKKNVVVSGATSSGKTSLISSLSRVFSSSERIICVEDTNELQLAHPHVVHLQTRTSNHEGDGEVTLQQLVRTSLRMRPDRLIIGEVRGAEAIDMILAMTTGHKGCWSTVHATSASDTLARLANIVVRDAPHWTREYAQSLASSAIDAIVHMVKQPHGRRRISEIAVRDGVIFEPVFVAPTQTTSPMV